MNKEVILSRAGEQLEECTVLYLALENSTTPRVYFDKECTRCLTADEMKEAYLKRCVVVFDTPSTLFISEPYSCVFDTNNGFAVLTTEIEGPFPCYSAEYVPS